MAEITGRIFKILPLKTGTSQQGNDWKTQSFVIETTDKYPKKVCLQCLNDKVDSLSGLKIGDELKVVYNPESREFKDNWYTDLKAWKVSKVVYTDMNGEHHTEQPAQQQNKSTEPEVSKEEPDDFPFA